MATSNMATLARVADDAGVDCEACGKRVIPDRPSRLWWAAVIASWVFLFAVGPLMMIFPLSLVGIPFFLMMAMPIVSFTSDKVHTPPSCPSCRRYLA
jgi:hypothetical protein